jgi:predicted metal-dependent hydrolase
MIEIDRLIRSNRKSIAIIVQPDSALLVRAPHRIPLSQIESLIAQKEAWIRRKRAEAASRQAQSRSPRFEDGALFPFLGCDYPLKLDSSYLHAAANLFTDWYRLQARDIITQRVHLLSSRHSFQAGKIRITSPRTRWGSCGAKGSLNFNWRLVIAPQPVIDYVVIHELVHLRQRNHSSAFWSEVGKLMPVYRQHQKWLKDHGPVLSAII